MFLIVVFLIKVAVRFPDTVTHIKKYTQFCWGCHIFDHVWVKGIQQSVFWQFLPVVGNVGNVGILAIFRKGVFFQIQILRRSNHENGKRTTLVLGIYVFGTHWCRSRKKPCLNNFIRSTAITPSLKGSRHVLLKIYRHFVEIWWTKSKSKLQMFLLLFGNIPITYNLQGSSRIRAVKTRGLQVPSIRQTLKRS